MRNGGFGAYHARAARARGARARAVRSTRARAHIHTHTHTHHAEAGPRAGRTAKDPGPRAPPPARRRAPPRDRRGWRPARSRRRGARARGRPSPRHGRGGATRHPAASRARAARAQRRHCVTAASTAGAIRRSSQPAFINGHAVRRRPKLTAQQTGAPQQATRLPRSSRRLSAAAGEFGSSIELRVAGRAARWLAGWGPAPASQAGPSPCGRRRCCARAGKMHARSLLQPRRACCCAASRRYAQPAPGILAGFPHARRAVRAAPPARPPGSRAVLAAPPPAANPAAGVPAGSQAGVSVALRREGGAGGR